MNLTIERTTSTGHRLSHYEGACHNIHGHNLRWTVNVTVDMAEAGSENMAVDLKDISETIDTFDHALVLNGNDTLVHRRDVECLGEIVTTDGDPTCEYLADWMAQRIYELDDSIQSVDLELAETEKYAVSTEYP